MNTPNPINHSHNIIPIYVKKKTEKYVKTNTSLKYKFYKYCLDIIFFFIIFNISHSVLNSVNLFWLCLVTEIVYTHSFDQ